MIGEIIGDGGKERGAKIAIFAKIGAVFEVNNFDIWSDSRFFGFFGKRNKRFFEVGEIVIGDGGGSGTIKTGNFERFGNKTSKTEGRIFGRVFLEIR